MAPLTLLLPWPPSVNRYWTFIPSLGRVSLSHAGRKYRETVAERVLVQTKGTRAMMRGRVAVSMLLWAPDHRVRDLDNTPKAVLDGLTKCAVWSDDCQVRRLVVEYVDDIRPGGEVMISIEEHASWMPRLAETEAQQFKLFEEGDAAS